MMGIASLHPSYALWRWQKDDRYSDVPSPRRSRL